MEHPFFHAGINATYYNRVCPVPSTALMLRHMLYWGCGPTDYRTGVDVMASFTNFATLIYNGGTSNSNTVTGELLGDADPHQDGGQQPLHRQRQRHLRAVAGERRHNAPDGTGADGQSGRLRLRHGHRVPADLQRGTLRVYVNGVLQTTPR